MTLSNASVLLVAVASLVSMMSISMASEVDGLPEAPEQCAWTGPTCIENCYGRPNGYYQSCRGCTIYVYCYQGYSFYRSCPPGSVWDDNLKHCNPTSTAICYCYPEPETCLSTGPRCITSCQGRRDGDYQSCRGCSIYASCSGGRLVDYRPCAPTAPGTKPLQWNDLTKQCNYTSPSCYRCYRGIEKAPEQDRLSWSAILKK